MRRAWLAVALVLAACGAPEATPDDGAKAPPVVTIAAVTTLSSGDPREAVARDAVVAGRYDEAGALYDRLATEVTEPALRAEFLFLSAECALAARADYLAFQRFQQLLREYPATPRFTTAVERMYRIGREFCLGNAVKPSFLFGVAMTDREFGVTLLEGFLKARERHPLADDALHAIAEAKLGLGEWEDAVAAWERLIRDYPDSDLVETAEYRSGVTMLQASDGPAYDQIPLLAALNRLKRYVRRYPRGDFLDEAEQQIATIEQDLAEHQLANAEFYLRRSRYYAADIYLAAILRDYPSTEAATRARELRDGLPRTSPPAPRADPDELGDDDDNREDRLRLAPAPIDDSW